VSASILMGLVTLGLVTFSERRLSGVCIYVGGVGYLGMWLRLGWQLEGKPAAFLGRFDGFLEFFAA
jgi:hypothetical protein